MRYPPLLSALVIVSAPVPLRAEGPACLLFHPTVPTGSYSGSAALLGGPGGVMDRCSNFPGASPWQLTNGSDAMDRSAPTETILLNAPATDFGFWVGTKRAMSLRFYLGDAEQYSTGWFITTPHRTPWWQWSGQFDRVEVGGLHVLMLHGLDLVPDDVVEPLLEPVPEEEEVELEELVASIEGSELNRDGELISSTVPEPATLTLLASGLVGMAGAARRRREAKQL